MKKWLVILLVVLLLPVLGMLIWQASQPREPLYEGKTVTYWLRHPITYPVSIQFGPKGSNTVVIGFPKMDSNAVPALIKHSREKDSRLQKEYAALWKKLPPWSHNHLPTPVDAITVRNRVAMLLGWTDTNSQPAAATLVRMAYEDKDSSIRSAASMSLGSFPPNMVADAWRVEAAHAQAIPGAFDRIQTFKADALGQTAALQKNTPPAAPIK